MNRKNQFVVIQQNNCVYLDTNGIKLLHGNECVVFLNALLMEKFKLEVCPAHQGGIYGKGVELINTRPIGLKNNLNYLSKETKEVLFYYEKFLSKCFVDGIFGYTIPEVLFDTKNIKFNEGSFEYVLKHYISSVLIDTELFINPKEKIENSLDLFLKTMKRMVKITEPSLMSPYVLGFH